MIDLRLGLAPALVAELPATSCKTDRRRALVPVPADHRRRVLRLAHAPAMVTDPARDLPANVLAEVTDQEFDLPVNVRAEATDRGFDHQANDLAAETDRDDLVMATDQDDLVTATVRDAPVMVTDRADPAMEIARDAQAMAIVRDDLVMETARDDPEMEIARDDPEMATDPVSATGRAIDHPAPVHRWPATDPVIVHRDTDHRVTGRPDRDRPDIVHRVTDHRVPVTCRITAEAIGVGIQIGAGDGAGIPIIGGPGQVPVQSPDGWPADSTRHRSTTTTAQPCTTKATTSITTTR